MDGLWLETLNRICKIALDKLITRNCWPHKLLHHQNGNLSVFLSLGHFELLGNTAYFLPFTQEVLWTNNENPALYSCLNFAIVCSVYLSAWHHQSARARSNVLLDTVQLWLPDHIKTLREEAASICKAIEGHFALCVLTILLYGARQISLYSQTCLFNQKNILTLS